MAKHGIIYFFFKKLCNDCAAVVVGTPVFTQKQTAESVTYFFLYVCKTLRFHIYLIERAKSVSFM